MAHISKLGIISPIRKVQEDQNTLAGSLAKLGYNRIPGTHEWMTPYKEINGSFRTGLDPEAQYIKAMEKVAPESAKIEKERVKELRETLEDITGLKLGPRDDYYTKVVKSGFNSTTTASRIKMNDGVNVFDLNDPMQAITFAWLRVHPKVAPSLAAYKEGRVKPDVKWYVENGDEEAKDKYNKKVELNKALALWTDMTEERRLKVARLLGLRVTYETKPEIVYNEGDTFLKATSTKQNNVKLFNEIYKMSDEDLEVKYLVEEAIYFNIYRSKKGRWVEGEVEIGTSKDDVINFLVSSKGQEHFIALKEKVRQKKIVELAS